MLDKILEAYKKDNILNAFLLYDLIFLPERTKVTFIKDLKYVLTYYHPPYEICSIYILTDEADIEILREHLNYCTSRKFRSLYVCGNIDIYLRYFKDILRRFRVQKKCFIVMKLDKNNFRKIHPKISNIEIRKLDLNNKIDREMFKEFLKTYFNLSENYIEHFRNDKIYVAICENKIISIARISLILPEVCLIVGVFTVPEYRRRGLAGAVLSTLCEHALNLDITPFLFVEHNNDPAINLYRKIGFRTYITLPYLRITSDETGGTDQ